MTKQEYNDLYDSLFYGHDVELELNSQHYFTEWCNTEIDIFALKENGGSKLLSIPIADRNKAIEELFNFKLDGEKSINSSYESINIIDVE